jgi:hypothetical protein
MKNTSLIKGLLAVSVASLIGTSAHATTVSTSPGDVVLAFAINPVSGSSSDTGFSINLEVDLGSITNFLSGGTYATGSPYSLSNFLPVADIATEYGSSWNSLTYLDWCAAATNGNSTFGGTIPTHKTVFATLLPSDPAPIGSSSQTTPSSDIATMVSGLGNGTYTALSGSDAAVGTGDESSFNSEANGDEPPFFDMNSLTADFQSDTVGTTSLALYEITPSSTGTELGTLTLSSSGLTFDSAPIPEPSTWATVLVGAATLIGLRRRRRLG